MHVSLQRLKTRFYFLKPFFGRWVRGRRGVIVLCVVYWWAGELLDFSPSLFSVASARTEPDLWDHRPSVTPADVFVGPQRSKVALWYSGKCAWAFVRKSTLVADALLSFWSVGTSTLETRPQHGGWGGVGWGGFNSAFWSKDSASR